MKCSPVFFFFLLLIAFKSKAGHQPGYFKLELQNDSKYSTVCTVLGNEKTDSVMPGQRKKMEFEIEDQPAFYLQLLNNAPNPGADQYKLIRILDATNTRKAVITKEGKLEFELTPDEKIIAAANPKLRVKNFWKLDSVLHINKDNAAAADIIYLSICDRDVSTDTIMKYFDWLGPAIKASAFGKRITHYLEARTRLTIGNKLDDFILADSAGKMISLHSIRADYVLLDFWFSRCGPCIKSFPDLEELHAKTSREHFEILGISVDNKADNKLWRRTIATYRLSWININDVSSKLVSSLAIVNYPTRILLDRNRKIILLDTDNSHEDFYRKVQELLTTR